MSDSEVLGMIEAEKWQLENDLSAITASIKK
jgi:hypothetical protein